MEQKIDDIRREINIEMLKGFDRPENTLDEALKFALEVEGKRLRPLLFLTFIDTFRDRGFDYRRYFNIACAIEYIHTYSLIHDDLPSMDNDDFRRGQPTVHKKFDPAIALLAGDTLLTHAFEKIADTDCESRKIVNIIKIITTSIGSQGMAGGQALDLQFNGNKADIHNIHRMKTAELISGSILSAAEIVELGDDEKRYVRDASLKIGIAFQMADDLLDIEGDEKIVGKKLNKDHENESPNSVLFFGKDQIKREIDQKYQNTLEIFKSLEIESEGFLYLLKKMVYRSK